jgi:hypothetical protein
MAAGAGRQALDLLEYLQIIVTPGGVSFEQI